ncbi:propionate/acetate kinase [Salmonella enterica subsp. arizonae]|uniref:Propionate/acetate kinase n=1 Tax=Salmonella enterica subsp. arizonae TaxID=59203 RepID=A0A2X4TL53_SALER|nr:propionate/acetate kinase [Salmonella enterica subsp. arizonae]
MPFVKAPSLAKYRGRLDNVFVHPDWSADHPEYRLQIVLILTFRQRSAIGRGRSLTSTESLHEMNFPVVLVINCGSSSIKFSVLDVATCDLLIAGIADGINTENAFLSINGDKPLNLAHPNYEGALQAIAFELEKRDLTDSVALIGHRIAHGGDLFTQSVIITDEVIDNIRQVSPLAPLHNYANLSGIDAARHLFPGVRQVAVFDTSFHQTLAPEAYLYGLPWGLFCQARRASLRLSRYVASLCFAARA